MNLFLFKFYTHASFCTSYIFLCYLSNELLIINLFLKVKVRLSLFIKSFSISNPWPSRQVRKLFIYRWTRLQETCKLVHFFGDFQRINKGTKSNQNSLAKHSFHPPHLCLSFSTFTPIDYLIIRLLQYKNNEAFVSFVLHFIIIMSIIAAGNNFHQRRKYASPVTSKASSCPKCAMSLSF